MENLIHISIGVVILYVIYRIMGAWILPKITERRFNKYKKDFFSQNPHIDQEKFDAHAKEEEDKTLIIEKRKNYK